MIGQRMESRVKGKELIGNEGAKKGRSEEAEGRKRRKGGNANRQVGLGRRLAAGKGGSSWARMSSDSNIRVGVVKRWSQMLDADASKARKTKR